MISRSRPVSNLATENIAEAMLTGKVLVPKTSPFAARRGVPQFFPADQTKCVAHHLKDLQKTFPMDPKEYKNIRNIKPPRAGLFQNRDESQKIYDPANVGYVSWFLSTEEVAMLPYMECITVLKFQESMLKNMMNESRKPGLVGIQRTAALPWKGKLNKRGKNYRELNIDLI